MYLNDLLKKYSVSQIAKELDIQRGSVKRWKYRYNGLIPERQLLRLSQSKKIKIKYKKNMYAKKLS